MSFRSSYRRFGIIFAIGITAVASLLCSTDALALDPSKRLGQYVKDMYTLSDGLPQVSVESIAQTSEGYLWIATQAGLARFDGVRFKTFNKLNTPAMTTNHVKSVFVDSKRRLWFGTIGGGAVKYEDGTFTRFSEEDGLASNTVNAISEAKDKSILFATGAGLSVLRGKTFRNYGKSEGMTDDFLHDVMTDRMGNLWVATAKGANILKGDRFVSEFGGIQLPSDGTNSLFQDSLSRVWVGTWGHGLLLIEEGKIRTFDKSDGLQGLMISNTVEDRDGNFWVATYGGGVSRLEGDSFVSFTKDDGLSGDLSAAMFEDREGNLWVGIEGFGLDMYRDGIMTSYSVSDGLPEKLARTMMEDRTGALWIGMQSKGVSRFKDGKFENFFGPESGLDFGVRGLLEDSSGRIWAGSYNGPVTRFEGGKFVVPPEVQDIPLGSIRDILEDAKGNIWFAVYGKGLYRLSKSPEGASVVKSFGKEQGFDSVLLLDIAEDSKGNLWLGTWGGGVYRVKDDVVRNYSKKDGLSNEIILQTFEDSEGNLWLASYGGGLILFRDGKFSPITTKEGLFEDASLSILEDKKKNLWMTGNNGVFKVSLWHLLDVVAGRREKVEITSFDSGDGMGSRECNGGAQPAAAVTSAGRFWFPTIEGISGIDPNGVLKSKNPVPMVLEQVLVDGIAVDHSTSIVVEPGSEKYEFHYTSTSFISPEKIEFQYQLSGFDTEWVEAGTRRVAYYTNLKPGDYEFKLKAVNADGVWGEKQTFVRMSIGAAYYQTLWFQVLLGLSFVLVVVGVAKLRIMSIKRRNLILEQRVKDRTAQLEQAHEKIVLLEKEQTEKQMAGGFAHEIRNSLAGAKILLRKIMNPDLVSENSQSVFSKNSETLFQVFKTVKPELDSKKMTQVAKLVKELNTSEQTMDDLTGKALKSVQRSLDVTTLIMEYSKIGNTSAGGGLLNISEFVSSIADEHEDSFKEFGITIERDLTGDAWVDGAETHFHSVFNNLLINAKDALISNENSGDKPPEIFVGMRMEEGIASVSVRDNGCGIDKEDIAHIFEPFFSTKPDTGTGLGLGMVAKYLSIYNGTITVDSELGQWTEFIVSLPAETRFTMKQGDRDGI